MQQIANNGGRAFFLHAMEPGDALPPPFGDEPYAALVWATRPTSDAQKQRITHALIAGGCRYVVCGGAETDAWEEAADDAYLVLDLPEDDVVITTSHRGEPPDEVVFFLVNSARTDRNFSRCLLLVVGADAPAEERLGECVREELDAAAG